MPEPSFMAIYSRSSSPPTAPVQVVVLSFSFTCSSFTCSRTSYQWNHTVCSYRLATFIQCNVLTFFMLLDCMSGIGSFLLLQCVSWERISHKLSLPSPFDEHLDCFQCFHPHKAAVNTCVQFF